MHLSWLGSTTIKLQTKHADQDVTVIIDPYKPAKGEFPRNFSPTVALFSKGVEGSTTLSQNPFIIETLGEFDLKGVMILALPGADGVLVFKLTVEGINIAHVGGSKGMLPAETIEKLGNVDVLFVSAGGGDYMTAEVAEDLTSELEPRIVIPIGMQSDSDPKAAPVNDFVKTIGLKPQLTDKKIILKQKDLPEADMQLMILEKNI